MRLQELTDLSQSEADGETGIVVKKYNTLDEDKDLTSLPPHKITELESKIRTGAKDLDQKWKNALELVQKAYGVLNIERPTPNLTAAWSQYEGMIVFAVKELSKARGFDADWRHTSVEYPEIDSC